MKPNKNQFKLNISALKSENYPCFGNFIKGFKARFNNVLALLGNISTREVLWRA